MIASKLLWTGQQMLVALSCLVTFVTQSDAASRCEKHACSPPIGNLASGRMLHTLSSCCRSSSSHHPICSHPLISHQTCPEDSHPPAHMTDDSFLHPDTWWESHSDSQDEIRLDLEAAFYLSHVVFVFKSPRPAAMVIERSTDFGKTWEVVQMFSQNCSEEFGLSDDLKQPGSMCTSRYSSAEPCSGGEVVLRLLRPNSIETLDPYSPEAVARLTVTNVHVRLIRPQRCPVSQSSYAGPTQSPPSAVSFNTSEEIPVSSTYAIYTLLVRGTCLCHGHAEHCVSQNSSENQNQDSTMVYGRCLCAHNTTGSQCEECAPLYNDRPWRPANGSSGESNSCLKCECHGHADSCHFSQRAWISSGKTSGGVCDKCQHNTVGRRCQRCRHGYHRRASLPHSSAHTCTVCWCDPHGTLSPPHGWEGPWCHPRSGQCHCKPGVGGANCDRCLIGYWGFGDAGCRACGCSGGCDPNTGLCPVSNTNNQVLHVPIGWKVPAWDPMFNTEEEVNWSKELSVSALHHTGKCSCKEKKLRNVSDLCHIKHDYAHDKGSHAEVKVKVRKVLQSGNVQLSLGTFSIYPVSWTSRGCTCPVLNPGVDYLVAGPEEPETGRLLVTMHSVVVPWTPRLGLLISEGLRNGCL
ncbi:netrin-4 isoform X2 [Gouania willdenowi]|uniref:netrin-4 isoform X2 n=1 Tax=Gouania willdenowi TaxID=441366 RepID=UPI0010569199|nr:netrin-4-like isoform X2 [Gouania willdenowi]